LSIRRRNIKVGFVSSRVDGIRGIKGNTMFNKVKLPRKRFSKTNYEVFEDTRFDKHEDKQ